MASHSLETKYWFVYLLRSELDSSRVYVGLTENVERRLSAHNAGDSKHTSKYRPWKLETFVAFSDRDKASGFERYLKTASGIAFANKRLR